VSTPVIEFERVHKHFLLHHDRPRSFREVAVSLVRRRDGRREELQVLRGISFAVREGEALGIIGENGAGKTTVLNLIAHIIGPTSGRITTRGRVSTLLELGTGFHPDLTGRDNIHLNGSILGLSWSQTRRRLDDIIAFAELERFIDVPMKHYSSGMYLRLGFSVAVHADPEILLVDEVLAVGDIAFQKKCLERIAEMRAQGMTILYVSHNHEQVRSLCDRVIWLNNGVIQAEGDPDEVVRAYLNYTLKERGLQVWELGGNQERGRHIGGGALEITAAATLDGEGLPCDTFVDGSPFVVRIDYRCSQPITRWAFGLSIHTEDGIWVTSPNSIEQSYRLQVGSSGSIYYVVDHLPLRAGVYELTVAAFDPIASHYKPYDHLHRMYQFTVAERERAVPQDGLVELPHQWLDERGWTKRQADQEEASDG
jgi:lipopolysaccharide transport system ATP-binding protein